jgi:glutathione S-transferase
MAAQPAPLPLIGAGLTFELLTSMEQTDFRVRKIVIAARSVHVTDACSSTSSSMLMLLLTIVHCRIAGVQLSVETCSDSEIEAEAPLATGLALRITRPAAPTTFITQSNAILRCLADAAPDSGLYGDSEYARSQVDQWLEVSWHEIEVPLAVIAMAKGSGDIIAEAKKLLMQGLSAVNAAVQGRTFLAGHRVTAADIALACAAEPALGSSSSGLLSGKDTTVLPHLMRWYMTTTHQPCFTGATAVRSHGGSSSSSGSKSAAKAASKAAAKGKGKPDAAAAGKSKATPAAAAAAPAVPQGPIVNGTVDAVYSTASWVHTAETQPQLLAPPKFTRRRVRVKELLAEGRAAAGRTVVVRGWLKTARSAAKGSLLFLVLNDGSCHTSVQIVAAKDSTAGFSAAAACGGVGACLAVEGLVIESPAKGQTIEVQALSVEVLGQVFQADGTVGANDYPLAKKAHSLEYLRAQAHLRPRTMIHSAVMRVRHAMAYATHKFFNDRGFAYVHTPLLTGADCEGAGEQFVVTTLLPEEHSGDRVDLPRAADGSIDYSKVKLT